MTVMHINSSLAILFLIIATAIPTHISLKHVLARYPRARTARALKVEWRSHPHHLQKRRARHVRPQPIPSGGDQTGPISVVLSYAASNPSHVIGDVPHLLSPCGWSRARVISFGAILVRFSFPLSLFPSFRIEPAVFFFLLFVGFLVGCRRSALSRVRTRDWILWRRPSHLPHFYEPSDLRYSSRY